MIKFIIQMVLIQNHTSNSIYLAVSNKEAGIFYEPLLYELLPYEEAIYDTSPEYFFALLVNGRLFMSSIQSKINRITVARTIGIYSDYHLNPYAQITVPKPISPKNLQYSNDFNYILDTMRSQLKYDFQPRTSIHIFSD